MVIWQNRTQSDNSGNSYWIEGDISRYCQQIDASTVISRVLFGSMGRSELQPAGKSVLLF